MQKSVTKYTTIANQFVFITAAIILLALFSNAFFQYYKEKEQAFDNLIQKGESIGKLLTSMSVEPLLIYDNHTISEFARSTSKQSHIIYTIYTDKEGQLITTYLNSENSTIQEVINSSPAEEPSVVYKTLAAREDIHHQSYPVTFDNQTLAIINIGLDKKALTKIPLDHLIQQISSSIILGLFIGIGIYIGFIKKISNPVKKLRSSANNIASFKFDEEVYIDGHSELTELADTFNLMRTTLKDAVITREKTMQEMEELNASLEDRVRERTNALEELNSQITHQATHDPLTGLPNRTLFIDRLNQAIDYAHRNSSRIAIFILDLNNFKEINDTLGHPEGDLVLKQVAHRIPGALRSSDTVSRLGGDEFALVLPDIDEKHAVDVANKIVDVLQPAFDLSSQTVNVDASIGIALYPDHGEDQASLIRHADVAMYQSKKHAHHVVTYSPEFDTHTPWRLALMADLKDAIDSDELELYYQPQITLSDHHAYGVEALLRWNHPKQGFISPDQFIYIAENSGLINTLSDWVLNESLRQWKRWHQSGLTLDMSINISARNLVNPLLVDKLHELMKVHNVESNHIKLEFTESTVMSNPDIVLGLMQNPKLNGIRYSIDDFGTGYSSLSYLKRLPVNEVKIDKSFVHDMDINEDDASIVHSVIDLTHNLGHTVVAEGVENEDVYNALKNLGCDSVQGYLIAQPVPASKIPEVIKKLNIQHQHPAA